MTNKELKKLTRLQLLELLVEQGKEMERLKRRAERAEEKLRKRMLLLSEAGSIAEASLRLNGVFEAAQAAADQYLDSVRSMYGVAVGREEEYSEEAYLGRASMEETYLEEEYDSEELEEDPEGELEEDPEGELEEDPEERLEENPEEDFSGGRALKLEAREPEAEEREAGDSEQEA